MIEIILLGILCAAVAILAGLLFSMQKQLKQTNGKEILQRAEQIKTDMETQQRALRQELNETVQHTVKNMGDVLQQGQVSANAASEARFQTFATENEQKLENIRATVEKRLTYMQTDNNAKLDQMRQVVDEKLQKTLDERMTQTFTLVNERLEQVYKGLGEMQTLAAGVGDLKKVLSNVKTRGILGEIQLGAILEEILSPEQYEYNVAVKKGSAQRVEYAIKLPTEDDGHIYLPIDSKFPGDAYAALMDAYESGSKDAVTAASAALQARIKQFARDIRDKYICPPETTEFAIMFLPTEGLYAEAVKMGMIETLLREYRVNIAGPSTMAALLNSLQMGFRNVAIQKRSGEVWKVLGAVKNEFEKFEDVLMTAQKRLNSVNDEIEKLVGTRTRAIRRTLKGVTQLTTPEAQQYLPMSGADEAEEGIE